jgi:hypothetical protein
MNVNVDYSNEQYLYKSNFHSSTKICGLVGKQLFASGNFFASRKSMTTWHETRPLPGRRPSGVIARKV